MTKIHRILLFVPPILLLVFPVYSQIQGKITQLTGTNTIQVSIIPMVDMSPPLSTTSSAQVVLRAKAGTFDPVNIQDLTGDWEKQNQFNMPVEAPGFDYFVFFMVTPLAAIDYFTGVEVPLFAFENNGNCTGIELVDNATDPFVSNNSLMVNAENVFTILQIGINENAYEGNTSDDRITCAGVGIEITALVNPVLCYGDKTDVYVKALNGKEPYTIIYKHLASGNTGVKVISAYEGTATLTNIPAGDYHFELKDASDSLAVDTFSLVQPPRLKVELEADFATCAASSDGVAYVIDVAGVSGDTISAYQYFWDTNPTISQAILDSVETGTYSVTVEDVNGCTTTESVFVSFYHEFFLYDVVIDVSCYGENDGIIDITPLGVAPPYEYNWSPNANSSVINSAAWMLGPGEYAVTVTAFGGVCSVTQTFTVEEPEQIELEFETVEPICHGDEAYLNILNINNVQGAYSVTINSDHTALSAESFIVEAGIPMSITVEDSEKCRITEDFIIPDAQEMSVSLGSDVTIKYGESVFIDSEIHPLTGVDMTWTPDTLLSCTNCPTPIASPIVTTPYTLTLTDANGCTASDDILIEVVMSRDIYIPNAFSPNGDNINDVFRPQGGFEITKIESFQIFDRWGGLVFSDEDGFEIEDEKGGWDGTHNGKVLGNGTYLYTMNVQFIDGGMEFYKGNVMVIK